MHDIEIMTRTGCHLCDVAVDAVRAVAGADDRIVLRDIDAAENAEIHDRYTVRVPVLVVDGVERAELQIGEDEVRAALVAATPATTRSARRRLLGKRGSGGR